jgi:signal peptidase I
MSDIREGNRSYMTETTNPSGERFGLQPEPLDAVGGGSEPAAGALQGSTPGAAPNAGTGAAAGSPPQASTWTMVRELVETVVLSLIIFLLIRQVVQNYRIENHSMEPNFYEGQFVLVNKLAYRLGEPERGDVVVFHNPRNTNEDYIKRIIALPGDTVEVRDASVFINGEPLIEDFPHNYIQQGEYMPPVTVADNQLFVMGDNRPNSSDSRVFGPIPQDLAVGKAWLRIWPLDKFGIVEHEDLGLGAVTTQ